MVTDSWAGRHLSCRGPIPLAEVDSSLLDQLYDPSKSLLRTFEKDRARFFHSSVGPASRGDRTILDYSATVLLIGLQQEGSTATARLFKVTTIVWIPAPTPTADAPWPWQDVPTTTPRGPHGEITSRMGQRHELMLVQGSDGWRMATDAGDDSGRKLKSPAWPRRRRPHALHRG